jgi:uncharacterized protein (DUF2164 family)
MGRDPDGPMRIGLDPERRSMLFDSIVRFHQEEFDELLSEFRAASLLDFFVRELGPPVYNQGVRDAAGYIQEKLTDIEGDVFEIEPRR